MSVPVLLGACSGGSFHTLATSLPQTPSVVLDPDRTEIPSQGDARVIAKTAIQVADENALRLLISWCNYDTVRERYAGRAESMQPRCVDLREYLAAHPEQMPPPAVQPQPAAIAPRRNGTP